MHEQLHEATRNSSFNDSLDLVVGAVREVRNSPASVDQDLVVEGVNEFSQNGECRQDLLKV